MTVRPVLGRAVSAVRLGPEQREGPAAEVARLRSCGAARRGRRPLVNRSSGNVVPGRSVGYHLGPGSVSGQAEDEPLYSSRRSLCVLVRLAQHLADRGVATTTVRELWWIASCACRARGPPTRTAAGPPNSATRPSSPPSRNWPPARSAGSWTSGTAQAGSRATRYTAATQNCGPRWKSARSAACWRWPPPMKQPPPPGSSARASWPRRPQAGLAEAVGRGPRQGAPFLRLGRHRPGRTPLRESPTAGSSQPHHRRICLLPLLVTRPGAACRAEVGRRGEMTGGGDLPGRKGPGRTGRAPGPPLHLVVPLEHPDHARTRLPHCRPPGW